MPCKSKLLRRVCRPFFATALFAIFSTVAVAASDGASEVPQAQTEALAMQSDQDSSSTTSAPEEESSNGPVLLVPVVLAVLALVAVSRRRES